ncbi:chromate efflux transporter [Frigoribacterium sp. ACAM 257]|uniref:chromate efflux transporter n=1 Tax=Frigoribacterium sp. ACAM 257 TaxID=2508998 RepID=UPI001CB8CB30|nr:chromate efflux transporter [Frigoribacterium sp. ACAM 257]
MDTTDDGPQEAPPRPGTPAEVLRAFAVLGVTSFGGPVAHLGYFRAELVERRRWLDDADYGDLVVLGQFLPGPASSQVGLGLGLLRGGALGALAAFVAFTLPSALLMLAVASGVSLVDGPVGGAVLSGLTIGAVAIVAHAVTGMARTLAPDRTRASVAVVAAVLALALPGWPGQLAAVALGVLAGLWLCRHGAGATAPASTASTAWAAAVPRRAAVACLVLFAALLVGLPLLAGATGSEALALVDVLYRSGALVLGGGHVVLPLLQAGLVDPGWVTEEAFLTGYAAAQAVPGPLFTFATYLGAVTTLGPGGPLGALLATLAIFAPGLLLLVGVLPFWAALHERAWLHGVVRGAGAAVVGLLAAALWDPVATTAITSTGAFCLALVCFVLLTAWRTPPWAVVLVAAAGGLVLALLGSWR